MDTPYKFQLMSKIDSVNALERSGYGATYRLQTKQEDRESIKSAAAMILMVMVLIIGACIIG